MKIKNNGIMTYKKRASLMRLFNQRTLEEISRVVTDFEVKNEDQLKAVKSLICDWVMSFNEVMEKEERREDSQCHV